MTPAATVQALTARHTDVRRALDDMLAGRADLDALESVIERHRLAIHLSAFWLLTELRACPSLSRAFASHTERVQSRLRTLRALEPRARMERETRAIVDDWLDAIERLVRGAANQTTRAGRELLVRAYQRADQVARNRTSNSVPAELD